MFRRIYEPKNNKVQEGWRKLCNEELHDILFFTKYDRGDEIKEHTREIRNAKKM
jgi:hypothetical protein